MQRRIQMSKITLLTVAAAVLILIEVDAWLCIRTMTPPALAVLVAH